MPNGTYGGVRGGFNSPYSIVLMLHREMVSEIPCIFTMHFTICALIAKCSVKTQTKLR